MIPDNTYEIIYQIHGHTIRSIDYTPTIDELTQQTKLYNPIELDPIILSSFYNHAYVYFDENDNNLNDDAISLLDKVIEKYVEFEAKNEKLAINIVTPKQDANPLYDEKRSKEIFEYLSKNNIAKNDIYSDGVFDNNSTNIYGLEIVENKKLLAIEEKEEVIVDKAILKVENILFDFDKYNIKPEYFDNLDLLANYLNDNPTAKIEIGGHTDWLGTASIIIYFLIIVQKQ